MPIKNILRLLVDTNNTSLSIKDMIKDPIILKTDKSLDKIDEQSYSQDTSYLYLKINFSN